MEIREGILCKGGDRMQVIRTISYQMMKHQEETGFAKKVLGNEKEDVWNAI